MSHRKIRSPLIVAFTWLTKRQMGLSLVLLLAVLTHAFWFVRALETRSRDHLSGVIDYIETGDAGTYIVLARNLRFHGVFGFEQSGPVTPTYFRAPGYPALIASLWLGEAPPITWLLLVQALLGIGAAVLVYFIGLRFGVGVLAGAGMALAPMSGAWTGEIMSETLYTFLIVLAIWFWLRDRHKWAGLIFGLSWLVRPTTMAFLAFVLLAAVFLPRLRKGAIIITAVACLTVSPWILRNLIVFHRFIPVAVAGGGMNLLCGTFDIPYHTDIWTEWRKEPSLQTGYDRSDPRSEEVYLYRALDRIKADPLHWIVIRVKQYPRLLIDLGAYLYPHSPTLTVVLKFLFLVGNIAVLLLAIFGGYLARSWPQLILFPIFILLFHVPLWVEPRYSLPMMPMVIILASVGVCRLLASYRKPGSRGGLRCGHSNMVLEKTAASDKSKLFAIGPVCCRMRNAFPRG